MSEERTLRQMVAEVVDVDLNPMISDANVDTVLMVQLIRQLSAVYSQLVDIESELMKK